MMTSIFIVREPLSRGELRRYAFDGLLVKAVVDCAQRIMAVGGGLHADEEQALLEQGSRQEDLWGINLYPDDTASDWIEFDSMINIRPQQGNLTRGVGDQRKQEHIRDVVASLIQ